MTDQDRPAQDPPAPTPREPDPVAEPVVDPSLGSLAAAPPEASGVPEAPAVVPPAPVVPAAQVPDQGPVAPPVAVAAPAPAPVPTPRGRTGVGTASRIIALLFGILQALLIVRIVLLLLIANQDNEIVAWVMSITDPFIEPFRGMFSLDSVTGQRGSVLDIAAIVALVAWTLIETLILAVLRLFDRRT